MHNSCWSSCKSIKTSWTVSVFKFKYYEDKNNDLPNVGLGIYHQIMQDGQGAVRACIYFELTK